MQHVTKLEWMDGWMERRGANTAVLTRRWSEQRTEGEGGRWVLQCVSVFGRYCFGLGRCGSTWSNIQAGCARAHTAAVPVLWEHVCWALFHSIHFPRVFPPASKLLFQKERKAALCFCFLALRCWKIITQVITVHQGRMFCTKMAQKKQNKIINQYNISGKQCQLVKKKKRKSDYILQVAQRWGHNTSFLWGKEPTHAFFLVAKQQD